MARLLVGFLMMLAPAIPICWADDLTDAIVSADPRARLQTGTGAALNNLLGPKEQAENAPAEAAADLNQIPPVPSYGLSDKDLHDPMQTAEQAESGLLPDIRLHPPKQDTALGHPDARPGVYYGNATDPSSSE